MPNFILVDGKNQKVLKSSDYNFVFNKETGFFARWGKTKEDDPTYSPVGPESADIEISTICKGVAGVGVCKFCYKSNTSKGENMSLDTFKKLFSKLPKHLTQIAFGIGDIDSNPDMWAIFDYAKENGVIPNVTVNGEGITDEIADRLASTCGAVAVSLYDKDKTYDTIKKLVDRGMTQVNIHYMISNETFDAAKDLLNDRITDERLAKLNAIVFLSLKQKGRAIKNYFTSLSQERFTELVKFALGHKIGIGFDSCSAPKFLNSVKDDENYKMYETFSEPCEATLFSSYFNVEGKFFPCSFIEGTPGWEDGIDIINDEKSEFIKDLWYNENTKNFRDATIKCRECNVACSVYNI